MPHLLPPPRAGEGGATRRLPLRVFRPFSHGRKGSDELRAAVIGNLPQKVALFASRREKDTRISIHQIGCNTK